MDRKSVILLVISFLLILLWTPLYNSVFPPPPKPPVPTNMVGVATNAVLPKEAPALRPASDPSAVAPPTPLPADAPEMFLTVTNDKAVYTFTSRGGGIRLIELKDYPETVERKKKGKTQEGRRSATLNTDAPVPVLALLGGEALVGDGQFQLTRTAQGVRAEKRLTNGLWVSKEFEIGTNYILKGRIRIENRGENELVLPKQEVVIGTATPMSVHDNGTAVGLMWHNGNKAQIILGSHLTGGGGCASGCSHGPMRSEYQAANTNVAWAAVYNQYFALAAIPRTPTNATDVLSRRVLLAGFQDDAGERPATTNAFWGYQTAFLYPAAALKPRAVMEWQYDFYAGPKEYNTLARFGAQYKNDLDALMSFSAFFGWFAQGLLLGLIWLHSVGLPYGVAIILLTVIIKLAFWPLTAASTKSMKRMQLLQPQMKEIQEKYKDNPQKMNQKLMEFMKEHKVSPLGGCLPILLQIPVFIGFYQMLQNAIELRGAGFLWAADLSRPDTLLMIPGLDWIPFFSVPGAGLPINPMPLIMGVTMLWQARMTPAAPGVDPVQQKIMKYMPMMFMVFLYNFSAGLTLYWTVQNLLTIAQMKLTKTTDDPAAAKMKTAAAPAKRK